MQKTIKVLDTTLRDGSYAINFKFSKKQTTNIAQVLDEAGIDLIEVGHGIGLSASKAGYGQAFATDEEYMEAASMAVKKGLWGIFAIPGICTVDDLEICKKYNMGFIRFGVSIDTYELVYPYIEKAKENSWITCVNFMKSHSKSPEIFERASRDVVKKGADYIYIVDSTGNMTPKEVESYCKRVKDLPVGFHGHNNLGLANANSIKAVECGARIIDCSLQGIGRSSGNAVTEHFVAVMQRDGDLHGIDLLKLLDASENYVKELKGGRGLDGVDIISGFAGFHSSYMNIVKEIAEKYDVDPRLLIIAICSVDKSKAPRELVINKARELQAIKKANSINTSIHLSEYYGNEQDNM